MQDEPNQDIGGDIALLIDKLSSKIARQNRQRSALAAQIKKDKALLASLQKHDRKPFQPVPRRPWKTRLTHGPKYAVLTAIDNLPKKRFTGSDVFEQVEKLFPGTVTRAQISSLLWKFSSSEKPKERVPAIKKINESAGGKAESVYEKAHRDLKPSNVLIMNPSKKAGTNLPQQSTGGIE